MALFVSYAFNWFVQEVDGHNFEEICFALEKTRQEKTRPSFILARTVKGKGVSFMEGKEKYHGVAPTQEEKEKALLELA
jgi:transketolase